MCSITGTKVFEYKYKNVNGINIYYMVNDVWLIYK